MSRNDVILGLVALVLVAFSLVVSLAIPRRNPDFPGDRMKVFALVSVALVVAMLAAVEAFGGEHELGEAVSDGEPPAAETAPAEEEGPAGVTPAGDPVRGEQVFAEQGCGSCHTFGPAGTSAEVGPDLDQAVEGMTPEQVRESIVEPNARIAEGFPPNVMPQDYGEKLSDEQLADLVAFLLAGG